MVSIKRSLGCCLLVLAAAANLSAQSITGTLTGSVSDASGAVIPGAAVTLTNQASGDVRRTVTNDEGYFTIAAVPAGSFDLMVEAKGFQKYGQTGIPMNGSDKRHVEAVLQVQGTEQTVEVMSAADIVSTVDSGEKSSVLNIKELQNFTAVGRSAAEFIKILPGMAQTGNGVSNRPGYSGEVIGINGNGDGGHQSALGYYSANGTPTSSTEIMADGAHVSDPGCNCATPINPNTDMIQEFKVLTSNFSAENSKGPVVIQTIAKAGTKNFHGLAYLYARHHALNSNDWLDNKNGVQKPGNKYFFPGFNVGGPVIIPGTGFNKNREKLFFFSGFEYFYQTLDTGQITASVPTVAMRGGDFSPSAIAALGPTGQVPGNPGSLTDPAFPGGTIPQSAWDKGGQALMNLYPMPNSNPFQTGGYNYVKKLDFNQNGWQWLTRVDYSISDNTKLFVRYNHQQELQKFPVMLWWRANPGDQVPYPSPIEAPNKSQSLSANLTHVFSPTITNEFVFGYTYIDFPNKFSNPEAVDRASLGYPYQGIFRNGISQIPNVQGTNNSVAHIWNPGGFELGGGNLFAIKHLATFGDNVTKVLYRHTLKVGMFAEYIINKQPSNSDVQGDFTFNTNWAGTSGNAYADMLLGRAQNFSQNNFNVLHNEAYRLFEFFVQDSWKITRRLSLDLGIRFQHLGQWYDRQGIGFAVWDPGTYSADQNALLPAINWNKRNSSIPISGNPTRSLFYAPRVGFAWDVMGSGKTVIRGGFGTFRFHTPQSTDGLDAPTGSYSTSIPNPQTLSAIDSINAPPLSTYQSNQTVLSGDDEQPVTYSYSVTVSRRLGDHTLLEASYVGNKTKYLYENVFHNWNAVPYGKLLGVPNANDVNYNAYRPLSYYQDFNVGVPDGRSNYNSLQMSLNRQAGRYTYVLNYTLSKTMGLLYGSGNAQAPVDRLNMEQNYGPLGFDRRHIINAAYSVDLPSPFKDNRLLKGLVNGWQLSGITQLQSGVNLQPNSGNMNFNLSVPQGSPLSSKTVNGTNSIQIQPLLSCDPRKGLGENQFINASCFGLPSPGVNGPSVMPELFGPWFFNSDLAMFKNFQISESRRLQFRFNAYNFLNHPIRSFGNDNNLNLSFAPDGKVSNSLFGIASNKLGRRIIQLAVKFYF